MATDKKKNNSRQGSRNTGMTIDEINAQYGKLPPQALEVEEAVLGALMLERDAYVTVADIIDTSSFYKEEHQKIFESIKFLSANEKPVDLLMVTQELKDRLYYPAHPPCGIGSAHRISFTYYCAEIYSARTHSGFIRNTGKIV